MSLDDVGMPMLNRVHRRLRVAFGETRGVERTLNALVELDVYQQGVNAWELAENAAGAADLTRAIEAFSAASRVTASAQAHDLKSLSEDLSQAQFLFRQCDEATSADLDGVRSSLHATP